ncbi:MAG TPA: hypothetical protein VF278_21020 [Pirellulales bacterium]
MRTPLVLATVAMISSHSVRWFARLAAAVCLMLSAATVQADSPAAPGKKPHRWFDPRQYVHSWITTADEVRRLEIVEMLGALAHGQPPDDGKGWFHGGQSRYGWQWLADRFDSNGDGTVSPEEFPAVAADLLARLDRDEDGKVNKDDFDWSSSSPFMKQAAQTRRLFGAIDRDHNGRLTKDEWKSFFDRAALDANSITPADLQAALFPPRPVSSDDDPTPLDLLRGFASGELGSISQGPRVGQLAPDFELPDHKRERTLRLSQYRDKKPVVLIFGSFT